MSEFGGVLARRRMVRAYDPAEPVTAEQIDTVVHAAFRAPSAGFTQAVSTLVLAESADRERYWQTTVEQETAWVAGLRTAPVLILVWTSRAAYLDRYAEPDKGWTDRDEDRWSAPYWYVDAGMAVMSALLSAVDLDLGACFFGIPVGRIAAVRAAFGVPDDQLSIGVISLGRPATGRQSSPRRPRRPDHDRTHHGRWESGDL